ncbi:MULTISPECIES: hypothetical protein [Nostocales]|uniref:Uncharacterized protein n=3 Tax=Nostocales TaxID=1161 RepID=A0A0C1NJW1_9CYAN|nr:hypothetical protein [Tolypothrix bouteillei]KAF3887929.1 hypothetical protein DA73_0400022370 [Tolypothrix bouteillei VB521301]
MDVLKIKKTIMSDLLELSGLSEFKGKEVEITISLVTQEATQTSRTRKNFMRFAGIAADMAGTLEDLEKDVTANRQLDLQRLSEQ